MDCNQYMNIAIPFIVYAGNKRPEHLAEARPSSLRTSQHQPHLDIRFSIC